LKASYLGKKLIKIINITKHGKISLVIIIGVVLLSIGVNYYLTNNNNSPSQIIDTIEIREYQGENLSSIKNIPENSIKGPQYIDKENYRLSITGLIDKPMSYTYDEIISKYQNYQKIVTLHCVEGWEVTILWEGVLIKDLLSTIGIQPDATILKFFAYDGYSTSVPLDYILDKDIIMAYKMNNVTLPPERGFPFQLVTESKLGYKWIKWITKIEVSDDTNYLGYWERRGYANDAEWKNQE
jgi:DMSO/TMAO reductase YedYZ molybdopterin-dependent catalytic subunit